MLTWNHLEKKLTLPILKIHPFGVTSQRITVHYQTISNTQYK